jgi:hypothetical protein
LDLTCLHATDEQIDDAENDALGPLTKMLALDKENFAQKLSQLQRFALARRKQDFEECVRCLYGDFPQNTGLKGLFPELLSFQKDEQVDITLEMAKPGLRVNSRWYYKATLYRTKFD